MKARKLVFDIHRIVSLGFTMMLRYVENEYVSSKGRNVYFAKFQQILDDMTNSEEGMKILVCECTYQRPNK